MKEIICPFCNGRGFRVIGLDYKDCFPCEASGTLQLRPYESEAMKALRDSMVYGTGKLYVYNDGTATHIPFDSEEE